MSAAEQVPVPAAPLPGHELAVRAIEGEPRILDTDLAERLGFAKPNNIRKLIRRHAVALAELGTCSTVEQVKRGQKTEEFYLNRRQALFITAKSETPVAVEITIELVRRFDEYERGGQPVPPINLRDPASLLRLSADLAKELHTAHTAVVALEAKVAEVAPRAAALDRLAARHGAENISDTAKALGVRPSWLFDWMAARQWIFRRSDGAPWRGFQDKLDAGLLLHVERPDTRRDDRSFTQCMVTPKGRGRLAELIEREKAAATP